MTAKLRQRRNKDYGPLKTALTEHINTIALDKEFFIDDLLPIAEKLGYSSIELSNAMRSIKSNGIVEHVGRHKKDYRTIIHFRRCKYPMPAERQTRKTEEYLRESAERAQRLNDAAMRLWNALGMPQVQRDPRVTA